MEKMLLEQIGQLQMTANLAQSQAYRGLLLVEDAKKQAQVYENLFNEQDQELNVLKAKFAILKQMVEDGVSQSEIFDFIKKL